MAKILKVFIEIFRGNILRNADGFGQNIWEFQQHWPEQQMCKATVPIG